MFHIRFKYFNLTLVLILFSSALHAQDNPALFNQYRYLYSDSPSIVYAGIVKGMDALKYDSIYKENSWKVLPPITKSKYPIEIRFQSESVYGVKPFSSTVLTYDTAFEIKRFLGNGRNSDVNLRADAVYNIIVQNAIFNLSQFRISDFKNDTVLLFNGRTWISQPYTEMFTDHESWYTLEYKVGNLFNRIYINLLYRVDFPDNQLLRRYAEIKKAFTSDL